MVTVGTSAAVLAGVVLFALIAGGAILLFQALRMRGEARAALDVRHGPRGQRRELPQGRHRLVEEGPHPVGVVLRRGTGCEVHGR